MLKNFLFLAAIILLTAIGYFTTLNASPPCTGINNSCYTWGADHPQYHGYCCTGPAFMSITNPGAEVSKYVIENPNFNHCGNLTRVETDDQGQAACGSVVSRNSCGGRANTTACEIVVYY